jgi:hypothetical protein
MLVVIAVIGFALGLIYFLLAQKLTSTMVKIESITLALFFLTLSGISFYLDVLAVAIPSLFFSYFHGCLYQKQPAI